IEEISRVPRFVFEETKPVITNEQLLGDIRRVAADLGCSSLPQRRYQQHGRNSTAAIKDRFGTWNAATAAAGLSPASERDIPEAVLHQNLEEVWMRLGRQPRKREMVAPLSRFTHNPYTRRYGGWLNVVRAFLLVVEAESAAEGRRLAMVDVADRADVAVRLVTCKLFFGHGRTPLRNPVSSARDGATYLNFSMIS